MLSLNLCIEFVSTGYYSTLSFSVLKFVTTSYSYELKKKFHDLGS